MREMVFSVAHHPHERCGTCCQPAGGFGTIPEPNALMAAVVDLRRRGQTFGSAIGLPWVPCPECEAAVGGRSL
jgi:hypothetical protein